MRIGRLWYNLKSPALHSYSIAYDQAKRDIEIEEEKTARFKCEQLEGLRKKEKKVLGGSGPVKQKDHHAQGIGVGNQITSYQHHQRPPQFQRNRMQPPHSPTRDLWRGPDQMYSHLYHYAPMTHHQQIMRAGRPNPSIPTPAQNNVPKEKAMHMID